MTCAYVRTSPFGAPRGLVGKNENTERIPEEREKRQKERCVVRGGGREGELAEVRATPRGL